MKRVTLCAAVLAACFPSVSANAERGRHSAAQAYCESQTTLHPDGSSDEIRICHTYPDGSK